MSVDGNKKYIIDIRQEKKRKENGLQVGVVLWWRAHLPLYWTQIALLAHTLSPHPIALIIIPKWISHPNGELWVLQIKKLNYPDCWYMLAPWSLLWAQLGSLFSMYNCKCLLYPSSCLNCLAGWPCGDVEMIIIIMILVPAAALDHEHDSHGQKTMGKNNAFPDCCTF